MLLLFKMLIIIIGMLGLGAYPVLTHYTIGVHLLFWSLLLASLLLLALVTTGRKATSRITSPLLGIAVLWIVTSLAIAAFHEGDYFQVFLFLGPLRLLRIAVCFLFASLSLSRITLQEVMESRLLPEYIIIFVLVFRAFTLRYTDLLAGALDQLHALGFPPLRKVIISCVNGSLPTHGLISYGPLKRLRIFAAILLNLMHFFIEKVLTVEIPEMTHNAQLLVQQRKEKTYA